MSFGKAGERDIRGIGHAELRMTFEDFRKSLTAANPPAELTLAVVGLCWDAKGDWTRAHESLVVTERGERGSYGFVERASGHLDAVLDSFQIRD